jgi:hypothetical protein
MKYLKLYENFSSDFYERLEKLDKEYIENRKKIRQDFKDEVDDYMFDITDRWGYESFIEEDDPVIWYQIRFKHEDVQKVYDELKMANDRLKNTLGLQIRVEMIYRRMNTGAKIYSDIGKYIELMFVFNDEFLRASSSGVKFNNPLLDEELEEKRLKITIS